MALLRMLKRQNEIDACSEESRYLWLRRCGFGEFEIVAQTTELPDAFASLAGATECDQDSLRTSGFYVVIEL